MITIYILHGVCSFISNFCDDTAECITTCCAIQIYYICSRLLGHYKQQCVSHM